MEAQSVNGMSMIRKLLEDGPVADTNDQKALNTAFLEACHLGDVEAARKNLERGARPDVQAALFLVCGLNVTPLLHAAADPQRQDQQRAELARLLISLGARPNEPGPDGVFPVHLAAKWGYAALLEELHKAGANLDAQDRIGQAALHLAVDHGNTGMANDLLRLGTRADVKNSMGETPADLAQKRLDVSLLVACEMANVEAARELLDRGADPNARDSGSGASALHIASGYNHGQRTVLGHAILRQEDQRRAELARLLISRGARPNEPGPDGRVPMHEASLYGLEKVVKALHEGGASPGIQDVAGWAPLHEAVKHGHDGVADYLLKNGARADVKSNAGQVPADLAKKLSTQVFLMRLAVKGSQPDGVHHDADSPSSLAEHESRAGHRPGHTDAAAGAARISSASGPGLSM